MKRIVLLSVTLAGAACASEEPGQIPAQHEPVDVVVSTAQRAQSIETFPATVVSERSAEIATRMSGTIDRVYVDVGSFVRAGEPLIALDDADIAARVSSAQAGLALAESSFRRIDNLATDGAASPHELDQATAALAAARGSSAEAEAQQAYSVVRAPFDGVITQRSVDAGDLAGPGTPLLTLVAPGALKVVLDLPAERLGVLDVGDLVAVELPGIDAPISATVTRTVPALGARSRTFRVEAHIDAGTEVVLSGSYARVRVLRSGSGSTWIPQDAIITRGQLRGIMTLEGEELRLRWVRVGQYRDGAVELLSGPSEPLTVVRRPAASLLDGTPVRSTTVETWAAPDEPAALPVAASGSGVQS